jgi:excisionase family DNA binding protein
MAKTEKYRMLSGDEIELLFVGDGQTRTAALRVFFARVTDGANNPRVSDIDLTNLIYGKENPLLRQDILPNQGVVTREVFDNPVYRAMTDLLGRKRAQAGIIAPPGSEYTMTVTEAARSLGVHPSAIRQAIVAGRLEAKKLGGTYFLRRADVDAFHPARRGPPARNQLTVRVGNAPGESFRIKVGGGHLSEDARSGRVIDGHVDRFDRVAVLSGGEGKHRFFEIEPGESEEEIRFGDFFVRGRFRFANKVNHPEKARAAWKSFAKLVESQHGPHGSSEAENVARDVREKRQHQALKSKPRPRVKVVAAKNRSA